MAHNHQMDSCPSCSTPLTLFTPRERMQHINVCLDSKGEEANVPRCAVCHRGLNVLTPTARQEHVNRCLDIRQPGRRQPQPVKKRPRSTAGASSRILIQARQHKQCDEKVVKLLTLLGLERYAQRFAEEEIDLDTLRILKDEDLVSLRIPDAARRRIADALHAVPILESLQRPASIEQPDEPLEVPTQKFATSRLGTLLRRRSSLFKDDEDDEYRPTQTAVENARKVADYDRDAGSPRILSHQTAVPESLPMTINLVTPTRDGDVRPNEIQSVDQSSDSEFDFEKDILEESQISLELKIESWKKNQIRKETKRHQDEMQRIEAKYQCMVRRLKWTPKSPISSSNSRVFASAPRNVSEKLLDFAPIDLTIEPSDDSKEPTKEKDGIEGERVESTENACDAMESNEDGLLDCCSDSDKEFVCEQILKSPPRGYRGLLPVLDFGSESDGFEDLSQRERLGSTKLLLAGETCFKTPKEGQDRSDDEVLDLVNEDNTEADVESGRSVTEGLFPKRPGADSSSSEEIRQTQRSRLKKKRTVTHEEITRAIRKDGSLYDRILKVESVSYETILQSIRSSGTPVSRTALTKYLHSEGIMYKGETASKSSRAYLNGLNSEF